MSESFELFAALHRPRLLVQAAAAARVGQSAPEHLKKLCPEAAASALPARRLAHLLDAEAAANDARLSGRQDYSPLRHVSLLAAAMSAAEAYSKTSGSSALRRIT